jgi:hypothetical protein
MGMDTTVMMLAILFVCFLHVYFGQPMQYFHLWVGMCLYFMGWGNTEKINQEKCSTKSSAAKSVEHFMEHNFFQIHNRHISSSKQKLP